MTRLQVRTLAAVVLIGATVVWRSPATGRTGEDTAPSTLAGLERLFLTPPDSSSPLMRWWWFGPSVTHQELEREMRAMKAGGIGGVEIQPVYPLALDDEARGIRTLPFLSDEFVQALRFVSGKAQELGLRVDLTLGSGWPFGGPGVPIALASAKLRVERRDVTAGVQGMTAPDIGAGERLIAAFLEQPRLDAGSFSSVPPQRLQVPQATDTLVRLPADAQRAGRVLFFIASRTGMQVKRAAVGGEGFVLDHYERRAIDGYLRVVGDRLMSAFGTRPPFAVFCDSLEAYDGDWTGDLIEEFERRRGYDLTAHLPALADGDEPGADGVRHDWGRTLTELVDERFLAPLHDWAAHAGTRLRMQAYGIPPLSLSSSALVDIPDGEGGQWTRLTASRWASSAAHIFGRPVASAETWTWLHSPAFRAAPLDMKAEADRHFLQGINQLVGHGWPYSPPGADVPGWRFYAAGAFNDANPWWIVMPDVMRYLQRVSAVLRQGEPVTDIAVYLPTSDAWAQFTPGHVNLFESLRDHIGGDLLGTIAAAGFGFDVFDDEALVRNGRVEGDQLLLGKHAYRAVILPDVERVPPATLRLLDGFVRAGGVVVATRRVPARAPGFLATADEHANVQRAAAGLFQAPPARGHLATDERTALVDTLRKALEPDVRFTPAAPDVGFVHRRLPFADVYFVANTSNVAVHTSAAFRVRYRAAEFWDPITGAISPVPPEAPSAGRPVFELALEPYAARVNRVLRSNAPALTARAPPGAAAVRHARGRLAHPLRRRDPGASDRATPLVDGR